MRERLNAEVAVNVVADETDVSADAPEGQAAFERARRAHLETIGAGLSGVVHDIRTPLNVILMSVDKLAHTASPEEKKRIADRIKRQTRMVERMVSSTLSFARGERSVWIRKIFLAEFFRELEESFMLLAHECGLQFELDLQEKGVAYFDAQHMRRALTNLVKNAIEASVAGGTVSMMVAKKQDVLSVAVGNQGEPIDGERVERLFEAFASEGKVFHSGLGLAQVKHTAEEHHGTVEVESTASRTVFTMRLPQSDDEIARLMRVSYVPPAP